MSLQGALTAPNLQAQLWMSSGRAAVDFYKAAFDAVEVYRFGGTDELQEVVAQLAVGSCLF
jgi:PhnB protein